MALVPIGTPLPPTVPAAPAPVAVPAPAARVKRTKSSVRHYDHWDLYISKVFAKVAQDVFRRADVQLSKNAMFDLNDLVSNLLHKLHEAMHSLMDANRQKTLTEPVVRAATKLTLSGELAKHAIVEADSRVSAYTKGTARSQSARADLQLSVSRVDNALQDLHFTRISPLASVYTTSVLEYILAEIAQTSINYALRMKQVRITPRHIVLAIKADEEMSKLFPEDIVAAGGVPQHINSALLPKKRRSADE